MPIWAAGLAFAMIPSLAAAAPAKGLVASYAFGEGARAGKVFGDSSGKRNAATGEARRVSGRYGRGAYFNGLGPGLVVRDDPSLDVSRALTVEAWVKPQLGSGVRVVVAKLGKGARPAYALYSATRGGGAGGLVDAGGGTRARADDDLPLGKWSHVALTYDGTTVRFFRNGKQTAAARASGHVRKTLGSLVIGGGIRGAGRFKGVIDEVRVYNRALTSAEIARGMRRAVGAPAAPKPAPSTPAPAPARPGPLSFGIVSTRGISHVDDVAKAGAHITRIEFAIGTPVADMREFIARAASQKVEVVILAGFPNRIPSAEEARSLAAWAAEYGPGGNFWKNRSDGAYASRYIEFGNESSYPYMGTMDRGGEYAQRARDASQAIAAANPRVGLLVQADDAGSGAQNPWIKDMFAAVPNLGTFAAGWTIHPYGPRSSWESRIQFLIDQTRARGAPDLPIFITEWGLATDNGNNLSDNYHWPTDMTYSDAAGTLTSTFEAMNARFPGRLAVFLYYFVRDSAKIGASSDREDYFGVWTVDGSPKGALTDAAKQLAAEYPAH
ncbi:MAG: LamG domain-containing protein [Thermoleophilia bacterium]